MAESSSPPIPDDSSLPAQSASQQQQQPRVAGGLVASSSILSLSSSASGSSEASEVFRRTDGHEAMPSSSSYDGAKKTRNGKRRGRKEIADESPEGAQAVSDAQLDDADIMASPKKRQRHEGSSMSRAVDAFKLAKSAQLARLQRL